MIWTGFIAIPLAIILTIKSCLLLMLSFALAIVGEHLFHMGGSFLGPVEVFFAVNFAALAFWIVLSVLLVISVTCFIFHVLLCVGLCQSKPPLIMTYFIFGGIILVGWMSITLKIKQYTALWYCAIYFCYLTLLVVHYVGLKKKTSGMIVQYTVSTPPPYNPAGNHNATLSAKY